MTDFNKIAATYTHQKSIQKLFGAKDVSVKFLAQGEYNVNFLLTSAKLQAVLRLNTGSQMHLLNQIAYEFRTLEILQNTGVTPAPLYLDDSQKISPHGMLIMEYLPGRWLEYEKDYLKAVDVFAKIHSIKYFPNSGLVAADKPARAILKECKTMASKYIKSSLAKKKVISLIRAATDKIEKKVEDFESSSVQYDLVLNNTEVNSSNFLVDDETGCAKLVDWEKAIFSIPAQDLSHFLVPTTTFWKTDFFFTPEQVEQFLSDYCKKTKTPLSMIQEQLQIFWPLTCLRGISWCAMAYIEYQQSDRPLKNLFAFKKIEMYLEEDFIQQVFKQII